MTTSTPTTTSFGGALNRAVNITYVKEGVLSRIDFPTGGYTLFDYESNQYLNGSTATLTGGLRVKTITSYDGSGNLPILKTYKYGSGESGYGNLNFSNNQFNYNATLMYYSSCNGPVSNYQSRSYVSNIYSPEDGNPVMYPYVTEYFGDPAGTTNGKIIYEFDYGTPPGDVDHIIPFSSRYYRNSFAWSRGKLTHKTVYDNVNNKLSETAKQYVNLNQSGATVGLGVYQYVGGTYGAACTGNACVNERGESVSSLTYSFTQITQSTGVLLESQVTETSTSSHN